MLTRAQIQQYAHRNGIGLQAQERDYIQHMMLYLLYRQTQTFIFKGGTALRVVYQGNRYSEDLDFNGPDDPDWIQTVWQTTLERLVDFGIPWEVRNEWVSEVGMSFDVSYQGPLYDGRQRTKGKVRVDINRRKEVVESYRELVMPEYDDLRPFVVNVITPEHLLAEKVRALMMRSKPRDAYDIFLMAKQGTRLAIDLVETKLAAVNMAFSQANVYSHANVEAALGKCQQDWERDLRPLLPQYLGWDEVSDQLFKFLAME